LKKSTAPAALREPAATIPAGGVAAAAPSAASAAPAPTPNRAAPAGNGPAAVQADPLAPKVSNAPGGLPAPWQPGRTLEQRVDPAPTRPAAAAATTPARASGAPDAAPVDASPLAARGFDATGGVAAAGGRAATSGAPATVPVTAPELAPASVPPAVAAVTTPARVALQRVRTVQPDYPPAALAAGREGRVELSFNVDGAGKVRDVRVVQSSPPGVFDEAARRAVRQWRYAPRDGADAAVETVELKFELD
jgi:protein TonB